MYLDFLSGLSFRTLESDHPQPLVGQLRPRLASQFESSTRLAVPDTESISMREVSVESDPDQPPGDTGMPPRQGPDRYGITTQPSLPQEPKPGLIPFSSEKSSLKHGPSIDMQQSPTHSYPRETMRGEPPAVLAQESSKSVQGELPRLAAPSKSTADIAPSDDRLRPLIQVLPPSVDRTIQPAANSYTRDPLPPSPAVREQQGAVLQEVVPARNSEGADRRVEITRMETQLPATGLQPAVFAGMAPIGRPFQKGPLPGDAQPPTIHVTIGRVEVKAVLPVDGPKHRAAKAPVMSLDEYLRRRQGNDR